MFAELVFTATTASSSSLTAIMSSAIDAINVKRTDTELMKPQQWLSESMDDEAKSYDLFGFIGSLDPDGQSAGSAVAVNYGIEIDLFIPDEEEFPGILQKKLKRYNQALLTATQNTWSKVAVGYGNVELKFLAPISASLNNSSRAYKLLGIQLKFTMVFN